MPLQDAQLERYARQLLVPEIGPAGQAQLLASRVLIVGVGGLGSAAALYLAAAGVGRLGLVDADVVDASNLARQVLHFTPDLGMAKVDSAAAKLRALNPETRLDLHRVRFTTANARELVRACDVVIDATDNFASKFLLADACHLERRTYVHAGVRRLDGQVLTVQPGQSTCYRCVFPDPPPAGLGDACAEAGVFGPVAGVIGLIQATEAAKCLLRAPGLLTDRFLVWNAWQMRFREVPLRRNPACPLCGPAPTIQDLDPARYAAGAAASP